MNRLVKNLGVYLVLVVLVVSVVNVFLSPDKTAQEAQKLNYSKFLKSVDDGLVEKVVIDEDGIRGTLVNGMPFVTFAVGVGDLAPKLVPGIVDQ